MRPGQLAVVATPIGNLADLTERAVRCLAEADLIVAEDTRRARALLSHLGLRGKRVERLDAEVEARGVERWLVRLEQGARVAAVTDAGCPTVSDPGAVLVRAAAARAIVVLPIPGASAVLAALVVSGFGADRFHFLGFVPRKGKARREVLHAASALGDPVVLFEAAPRLQRLLSDLAERTPARPAMIAREITKAHEQLVRGSLSALAARGEAWRGEITVVLGPHEGGKSGAIPAAELDRRIAVLRSAGCSNKQISLALAFDSGWGARAIYRRAVATAREG